MKISSEIPLRKEIVTFQEFEKGLFPLRVGDSIKRCVNVLEISNYIRMVMI